MWGGADKLNSLTGTLSHNGTEIAKLDGHWDKIIYYTPKGGSKVCPSAVLSGCAAVLSPFVNQEVLVNLETAPVMPKYVLPIAQQNPWESRRLWSKAANLLNVRPTVDWDAVDAAKGELEHAQRQLPVHQKVPGPWYTKKFHERPFKNPLTGADEQMYTFDYSDCEWPWWLSFCPASFADASLVHRDRALGG